MPSEFDHTAQMGEQVSLRRKPSLEEARKLAAPVGEPSQEPSQEVPDPALPIPDLVVPAFGFHVWGIDRVTAMLKAWGGTSWTRGGMVATCKPLRFNSSRQRVHSAPHVGCSCGLYSTAAWEDVDVNLPRPEFEEITENGAFAVGVVKGWGRVLLHERGWRAEKAAVVALLDPCAIMPWFQRGSQYHLLIEYTANYYGVPLLDHMPDLGEFERLETVTE